MMRTHVYVRDLSILFRKFKRVFAFLRDVSSLKVMLTYGCACVGIGMHKSVTTLDALQSHILYVMNEGPCFPQVGTSC